MRWFAVVLSGLLISAYAEADSLRCRGKLVRPGESSNALARKCGEPARRYRGRAVVETRGSGKSVSVSNWVYERKGRKDMIVSVSDGVVVRVSVDRN